MPTKNAALVSTFELLLAPIAPASGPGTEDVAVFARRVIQGYFLTISNLECDRELQIEVRATIPPAGAGADAASKELSSTNHFVFFNVGGAINPPKTMSSSTETCGNTKNFTTTIKIPGGQTGSFALLPNILDDSIRDMAKLSIRGYIELRLTGKREPFKSVTLQEARVLLSAEHRGTFLPQELEEGDAFDSKLKYDFDQLAYALPIAGGDPVVTIPKRVLPPYVILREDSKIDPSKIDLPIEVNPDFPWIPITVLRATRPQNMKGAEDMTSKNVEVDVEAVKQVNEVLKSGNIPLRLEILR